MLRIGFTGNYSWIDWDYIIFVAKQEVKKQLSIYLSIYTKKSENRVVEEMVYLLFYNTNIQVLSACIF
jgi:hypothetical protein